MEQRKGDDVSRPMATRIDPTGSSEDRISMEAYVPRELRNLPPTLTVEEAARLGVSYHHADSVEVRSCA